MSAIGPPGSPEARDVSASTARPAAGRPAARIALVMAVVGTLLGAYQLGLFRDLQDPQHLAERVATLGVWGYLGFIACYTCLQPFGVPGTVFVFAAPLIWPWPIAFALSLTGSMTASMVGFSFARFVARDWLSARIPAKFRAYDRALEERAFLTVALLRFVFWMPQLLHAFFGVSRVRGTTHFWGSLVGYTVPLLVVSYFGPRVVTAMRNAPPWLWVGLAATVAALVVGLWALRRAGRPSK